MVNLVKIILCLLLTLLLGCNQNQTANSIVKNDSIEKYLNLASNDTFTYNQRNQYNQKAFSLIDLSKNDTLVRFYLSEVSYNNLSLRNWRDLKKTSKILFEKAIKKEDTLNLARYFRYKGGYYKHNQIYDSAFYFYYKSERLYKKLGRNYDLGNVLLNKGAVQFLVSDFLGAELTLAKAEFLLKKSNYDDKLCRVLISLGAVYGEIDENQKALKTYKDGYDIYINNNLNDRDLRAICLNNIGNVYCKLNKTKLANKSLNEALKIKGLERIDPELYGFIIFNIANVRMIEKKFKEAKILYLKSLIEMENNNEVTGIIGTNIGLSNYYSIMKDTIKAIEYAQKAKAISIKSKLLYGVSESLQQLIKVDIKNASKNAEEYIKVNNSMQNTERQFRNKFARIAYETDEIQQEKEQAIKQKWIISGIAAFVFLIGLLLFIITKQRSKQKELLLLQSQQKANEEIYQLMLTQKTTEETARQTEKKRIALELHDGIMNKLASTRLNLFVLSKKTDTATIEKCLTHISDIYTIEQEIRSIAHDLNQDVFKEANSFISLLKDFIAEQNTTSNSKYKLELQHDINWIAISSEIKMNLYRIIQEASHNINKYSKAKNVVVSIIQDGYNVCMSITDDGVGFDTSIINDGIGIKNMQQRIKSLNGKFTINSTQKNSTSINLSIPIG
jgi:two-component system, NarL family, sensor kinase